MDSTWYDSFFLEGREGCFVFDTGDEVYIGSTFR